MRPSLQHSTRHPWQHFTNTTIVLQRPFWTRKTKLWDNHPDTLTSMANLAETYRNQGRWSGVKPLAKEAANENILRN